MNCAVTAFLLQFIVLAVAANWVWDVRSAGCKMYSVVRHGSYQLSLSEGLAESHRSAMHQHTALLSHLAVTALRPAVERRAPGRDRVTWKPEIPAQMWAAIAARDYKRSRNLSTYQMLESSSPRRLESKSSRSTACMPWSSAKQAHNAMCSQLDTIYLTPFHVIISCVVIISKETGVKKKEWKADSPRLGLSGDSVGAERETIIVEKFTTLCIYSTRPKEEVVGILWDREIKSCRFAYIKPKYQNTVYCRDCTDFHIWCLVKHLWVKQTFSACPGP